MKILGIAIGVFFVGLVLWALAANATPSASNATRLQRQSDQLAGQKCHWEGNTWVCCDSGGFGGCARDEQEHNEQLAQYDGQERTDEAAEWKRRRELWVKRSRTQLPDHTVVCWPSGLCCHFDDDGAYVCVPNR
ncbi:MAG TPA: hypothetical protein VGH47_15940 [Xanthobacteraceae bacterium]|jgi:hypothetical protein